MMDDYRSLSVVRGMTTAHVLPHASASGTLQADLDGRSIIREGSVSAAGAKAEASYGDWRMMLDRNELTKLATAMGGLPVIACRRGSPADLAGVRYGDIVLAVNGVKTPDWAAFIEARKADSTMMLIELFREGVTLTIEVPLSNTTVDTPTLLAEIIAENIVPLETSSDGWHPRETSKPN